jgi:hypothetical protein
MPRTTLLVALALSVCSAAYAQDKAYWDDALKRAQQVHRERAAEAQKRSATQAKSTPRQRGPEAVAKRKRHADEMESRFLSAGMDMHVYAEGDAATTLRLRYILMSRPLIFKLTNETKMREDARSLGFERIVFADGYKKPHVFDLIADKFE